MLGTGCQWRAIPKRFPPFASIQNQFHAWCRAGVLERMLDGLRALARDLAGRSEEPTATADRQQVSKDHGKRRAVGTRRRKEDQGQEASRRGGRGGVPDHDRGSRGLGEGPERRSERDPGMREKAPPVTKLWADGGCAEPKLKGALAGYGLGSVQEIVPSAEDARGFTVLCRRRVARKITP